MVGQTRASPNGFGASGSDAPPPPPNMTIQEQFMVTQTEVMRQLLQTQQQLAQQLQNNPRGENIDGQPRVTKYEHFYAMKPRLLKRPRSHWLPMHGSGPLRPSSLCSPCPALRSERPASLLSSSVVQH
jgi:hypothetical protein